VVHTFSFECTKEVLEETERWSILRRNNKTKKYLKFVFSGWEGYFAVDLMVKRGGLLL